MDCPRAGGANKFQLLPWVSNGRLICHGRFLSAFVRLVVELHFLNFLSVPAPLIFHEIKIGRLRPRGATTAFNLIEFVENYDIAESK